MKQISIEDLMKWCEDVEEKAAEVHKLVHEKDQDCTHVSYMRHTVSNIQSALTHLHDALDRLSDCVKMANMSHESLLKINPEIGKLIVPPPMTDPDEEGEQQDPERIEKLKIN